MELAAICRRCGEPVTELIPSPLDEGQLACAQCGTVVAAQNAGSRDDEGEDLGPWWVCQECSWEGRDPDWDTDSSGNLVPYCPCCEGEVAEDD